TTREDALIEVTMVWLKTLGLSISKNVVKEDLNRHPDYPSLLSLSQVLSKWGIENVALRLTQEQLKEVETPFLTLMHKPDRIDFVVVNNMTPTHVSFTDTPGSTTMMDLNTFTGTWGGTVLLAEAAAEGNSSESIRTGRRAAVRRNAMWIVAIALIGLVSWM